MWRASRLTPGCRRTGQPSSVARRLEQLRHAPNIAWSPRITSADDAAAAGARPGRVVSQPSALAVGGVQRRREVARPRRRAKLPWRKLTSPVQRLRRLALLQRAERARRTRGAACARIAAMPPGVSCANSGRFVRSHPTALSSVQLPVERLAPHRHRMLAEPEPARRPSSATIAELARRATQPPVGVVELGRPAGRLERSATRARSGSRRRATTPGIPTTRHERHGGCRVGWSAAAVGRFLGRRPA